MFSESRRVATPATVIVASRSRPLRISVLVRGCARSHSYSNRGDDGSATAGALVAVRSKTAFGRAHVRGGLTVLSPFLLLTVIGEKGGREDMRRAEGRGGDFWGYLKVKDDGCGCYIPIDRDICYVLLPSHWPAQTT